MAFGKKPSFGSGKPPATPTPPPAPKAPATPSSPPEEVTESKPEPTSTAPAPEKPAAPVSETPTSTAERPDDAESNAEEAATAMAEEMRKKAALAQKTEEVARYTDSRIENADYRKAKGILIETLLEKLDLDSLDKLAPDVKKNKIVEAAAKLLPSLPIPLNDAQHGLLLEHIIDEVLGFGPLEPLLKDPDVSDIMVNTAELTYVEKSGKLQMTDVRFINESHLLNVIQKIVGQVGRSVDEANPMVDARMPDGSRFNAIIPPLAIDGSLVSIRKFKKNKMPLSDYIQYDSMTEDMYKFLEICAAIRLNIVISGGTGSGKTTLLNALSGHISLGERVITIEDAAELQLHQPHVLRLETRPPNMEGTGEITQRLLVKNALRMRPDRIILGEIRGDEVIDVLAAMNTGHDGSMATIHANNPRDCLARIENLVGLSGISLPMKSLRYQIASAVNLIVQISRMRDGRRRITHIEEIVGLEGDIITTQQLFGYKAGPMGDDGVIQGKFFYTGIKPRFYDKVTYFNLEDKLDSCLKIDPMGM